MSQSYFTSTPLKEVPKRLFYKANQELTVPEIHTLTKHSRLFRSDHGLDLSQINTLSDLITINGQLEPRPPHILLDLIIALDTNNYKSASYIFKSHYDPVQFPASGAQASAPAPSKQITEITLPPWGENLIEDIPLRYLSKWEKKLSKKDIDHIADFDMLIHGKIPRGDLSRIASFSELIKIIKQREPRKHTIKHLLTAIKNIVDDESVYRMIYEDSENDFPPPVSSYYQPSPAPAPASASSYYYQPSPAPAPASASSYYYQPSPAPTPVASSYYYQPTPAPASSWNQNKLISVRKHVFDNFNYGLRKNNIEDLSFSHLIDKSFGPRCVVIDDKTTLFSLKPYFDPNATVQHLIEVLGHIGRADKALSIKKYYEDPPKNINIDSSILPTKDIRLVDVPHEIIGKWSYKMGIDTLKNLAYSPFLTDQDPSQDVITSLTSLSDLLKIIDSKKTVGDLYSALYSILRRDLCLTISETRFH